MVAQTNTKILIIHCNDNFSLFSMIKRNYVVESMFKTNKFSEDTYIFSIQIKNRLRQNKNHFYYSNILLFNNFVDFPQQVEIITIKINLKCIVTYLKSVFLNN